ncbi:MAG: PorV/PorQ family protein [Bacteroidales bacterium]|nr:PorV/PorQ family protein [Bacteroidales bacterium]
MKRILFTAIFALCGILAPAQVTESIDSGAPALGFAVISPNPAPAAMGYSGLASTRHCEWVNRGNVAAAAFSEGRLSAGASYSSWAPSEGSVLNAGTAFKFGGKLSVSLDFGLQKDKPYTEYDATGNTLGEFTPGDMQASLGFAYAFGNYSAGAGIHYLSSSIASGSKQTAICADVAGFAKFDSFNLGAGMKNIGSKVKDSAGNEFSLPSYVFVAGEYRYDIAENSRLKADADIDYYLSAGFSAAVGAELSFKEMLYARAGYHLGNDALPSFTSLGIGVKLAGVSLDAAYILSSGIIGGTFSAALGICF